MTDQELFKGLKAGENSSIQQLYTKFFPSVRNWISKNSGTEADAYDIFQECLETILFRVHKMDYNLGGLIMQISKRKWIDQIRKKSRHDRVINDLSLRHEEESIEERISAYETDYLRHQILDTAFNKLSALCQKLLEMVKRGESTETIQKELQFNQANTLYRRKSACMQRWSELVKQDPRYRK